MNIGEAARAAGVSAKMIRHYEQIGLIPAAGRTEAGYRQYEARDVALLGFVRQARRLGFSMQQIAELIGLWSDRGRASRKVKELAQLHLAELEQKLRELTEMKVALERLVEQCHGNGAAECAILDELALGRAAPPQQPPVSRERRAAAAPRAPSAVEGLMSWTRALHPGSDGR